MPTDRPENPLAPALPSQPFMPAEGFEEATVSGASVQTSGKSGRKGGAYKLLKSAFKRGDTSGRSGAAPGGFYDDVGGDSMSFRLSAKPPSGRHSRKAKYADDTGSTDSDWTDRDSLDGDDGPKNAKLFAALRNAKINYAYESYPWEKKMRELLPLPNSSCFLSLLLLPKASDASAARYNSLEDTLARADTWLISSQSAGVPIVFMNVQTEALLTKISGETASATVNMGSLADLAHMANVSLYGFEDYHGVDIGVVRAVRLWYSPIAGEMALEVKLQPGDIRLGFAISRTEEGFIYVSSVADENSPGVASTRSGLLELYRVAQNASKLLVISRVGGEKVLPWMVATSGDIKCFDTVSLSQKLSLHRHALRPITLHFLMWDDIPLYSLIKQNKAPLPLLASEAPDEIPSATIFGDRPEICLSRESPGDCSFRFQNINLPDSWNV